MQVVPNQAQPKIFRGSPNCSYDKTCPSNISLKIPKPMPIQNRLSNSAPECNGSTGKEGTQGLQVGSHCGLRYHASGHAFFLSRKASRFTHEYFMYAKVKMLLLSSRFVCVILALSLHENPRQFSMGILSIMIPRFRSRHGYHTTKNFVGPKASKHFCGWFLVKPLGCPVGTLGKHAKRALLRIFLEPKAPQNSS